MVDFIERRYAKDETNPFYRYDPDQCILCGRCVEACNNVVMHAYVGRPSGPMRIRTERFKTLVILDEIHHAGDALSWGEGVREAFEPVERRAVAAHRVEADAAGAAIAAVALQIALLVWLRALSSST